MLYTAEYEGNTYLAVILAGAEEEERLNVSILKATEEDGEPLLCAVEDEGELERVYNYIMDALYEEEEE